MSPPDLSPAIIGREIRALRRRAGLTLEQLGGRAHLTPSYIGSIENGERDPSLSTIQALAAALGVPTGQLFGGVPLTRDGLVLARLFDRVPPASREGLVEILRAIAGPGPRPRSRASND
jgi:transcriptional regulator with XRE-family HTH domain